MKFSAQLVIGIAVLVSSSDALPAGTEAGNPASASFSCTLGKTKLLPLQALPFPDNTQITNQFERDGILFSAGYVAHNFIGYGDTSIVNPGTLTFTTEAPVITVSLTFNDQNENSQAHFLQAFDKDGTLLDQVSVADEQNSNLGAYKLTVSSCQGIAYVVASDSPPGAKILTNISYSTKREEL